MEETKWGLSRAQYYADFVIAPVAAAILAVLSLLGGLAVSLLVAAGGGWVFWTWFEYTVHRFVFHGDNKFAVEHAKHHADEGAFIGVSPVLTWAGFCALFALSAAVLGPQLAQMFTAGSILGYFRYIWVHDRMHHTEIVPGNGLYGLKIHHVGHHRGAPGNYGVSTKVWDRVFRTLSSRRRV